MVQRHITIAEFIQRGQAAQRAVDIILADDLAQRDPLAILHSAIDASLDRDMRHDRELMNALEWLAEQSGPHRAIIDRFTAALDVPHPVTRRKALAAAYRRIRAALAG